MKLSSRVETISESVTLKLNAKAIELAESGRLIYNLTAGQLPFRPYSGMVKSIVADTEELKSFQYAPVPGFPELRKKFLDKIEITRQVNLPEDFDCVISNGGKHSIFNILAALINPGDEVVLIAPYWVSYPEMIKLLGGTAKVVKTSMFDNFHPSMEALNEAITDKTRAIIINSPSNPSGTQYSGEWMQNFGAFMKDYPEIGIISDEIYFDLNYYDPAPTFFYQSHPELLPRTIICDGISKSLACTGLRIGYFVASKEITKAVTRFQGHTTSGANSLIQKALIDMDFDQIDNYLKPIKSHLRDNSEVLKETLRKSNLSHLWYQSVSAFYFLLDFSRAPVMEKFRKDENDTNDYAADICQDLLENFGVATVPSTDFGLPNSARISLVLEKEPFSKAMGKLVEFLQG